MKTRLKLVLSALLLTSSLFGQAEQLNSTSVTGVSVGRGRPMTENIGAAHGTVQFQCTEQTTTKNPVVLISRLFHKSKVKCTNLDTELSKFTNWVKNAKPTQSEISDRLALFADAHLGNNFVNITVRDASGTIKYAHTGHNLRTNAGANWQADIMASTSTPSVNAQCTYIALTNDSGAPAAGDTTLASEIAANGLSRAQGTYSHTSNATSFTVSKTFTASGTQASQKTGLFTASSSGTMCFENTYTAVTVNNTDTLTVTWTINF